MIFVDFETRSRVDIRKEGGRNYAESDTSELLCGVAIDSATSTVYVWSPFAGPLTQWKPDPWMFDVSYAEPQLGSDALPQAVAELEGPLIGHNAWGFDEIVWDGLGYPKRRWLDTMPLVRRRGLPAGLDQVGHTLFGTGKDKQGHSVTMRACKPMKNDKFLDPDAYRLSEIVRYCIKDVLLLAAVWEEEQLGLPHVDDPTLEVCRRINARGMLIDLGAVAALGRANDTAVAEAEVRAKTLCPYTMRQVARVRDWLSKRGVDAPDLKAPTVRDLLRSELPDDARAVLECRLVVASITAGKIATVKRRVSSDGRLRDTLAYHGAHTGRWAGRAFQPHNLPRPVSGLTSSLVEDVYAEPGSAPAVARALKADPTKLMGSLLRGVLIGPELLARVDYSAIEARGLLWLAGDEEGLDVFRAKDAGTGPDPYVVAAKDMRPDYTRLIGKLATLLLGYQGGPGAFIRGARTSDVDVANLDVESIVNAWRDSRPLVAGTRKGIWTTPEGRVVVTRGRTIDGRGVNGLWKDLHRGVRLVVQRGGGKLIGRCYWYMEGPHLTCKLPSGRPLVYRDARVEEVDTVWGTRALAITYLSTEWRGGSCVRKSTYGGKLCENITQAVCRDLLAEALVRLDRAGVRTVLHVHDEIVAEVSDESELEQIEQIMRKPPQWAEGFPIEVEGKVEKRYGK